MLIDAPFSAAAFEQVLMGMAQPWVIALVLALMTLLLEDLAIAAGVALAAQGAISWGLSLGAVAGGIALGDAGLYGMGLAATRVPWLQRRSVGDLGECARARLLGNLPAAVLLARVIPGLRLVTYTAAGLLRVPPRRFFAWVLLAVTVWTAGLYATSALVGAQLALRFGLPAPVAVALPIVALAALFPLLRLVRRLVPQRFSGPLP